MIKQVHAEVLISQILEVRSMLEVKDIGKGVVRTGFTCDGGLTVDDGVGQGAVARQRLLLCLRPG